MYLISFYPYRAMMLAIALTSWRRPSKCFLLRASGQASALEPRSHQTACTPDLRSPPLGRSHRLRVCDNFLNSSMALYLRYHRIGVQKEGRKERKGWWKNEAGILGRLIHERLLSYLRRLGFGPQWAMSFYPGVESPR